MKSQGKGDGRRTIAEEVTITFGGEPHDRIFRDVHDLRLAWSHETEVPFSVAAQQDVGVAFGFRRSRRFTEMPLNVSNTSVELLRGIRG